MLSVATCSLLLATVDFRESKDFNEAGRGKEPKRVISHQNHFFMIFII